MIFIPVPQSEAGASPLPPPSRCPQSQTSPGPSSSLRPQRQRKPSAAAREANANGTGPAVSSRQSTASSTTSPNQTSPLSSVSPPSSTRSTPEISVPPFAVDSPALQRDLARVWEAINGSRRIVVVCGAGISVSAPASIPDFRSSTGLFKSLKEQHPNAGLSSGKDLFDARLFSSESNTALFYSMIASLHSMTLNAQPTLFHHFLKRLDEQGRLQRVYTQNIDALEERAGLTFGLGHGASRTFKKTASLGKRKRAELNAAQTTETSEGEASPVPPRRQGWNKVQSAPAVSLGPTPSPTRGTLFGSSPEPTTAMFPRVIPLHGSLANLVCTVCDFKMSTLPSPTPDVQAALDALNSGEPPHCPECHERDAVRITAGLRSRGIGIMKPDVVLYNGPNKSGERVGECLERDVLGLRDRLDGRVPETYTEEKLRLKKEEKDRAKKAQETQGSAATEAFATGDESLMSICSESGNADDVLGKVFEEDEQEEEEVEEETSAAPSPAAVQDEVATASPTAKLLEGVRARKSIQRATTQPAGLAQPSADTPTQRNAKMKPLPPDLLIVAGTSLKVPGTKRAVREFAKAARARDGLVPKNCKSRLNKRNGTGRSSRDTSKTPSNTSSGGGKADSDSEASSDEDEDDEEGSREDGTNPYRPIRTILLNYDFPIPAKEWEGLFDVWVQGDVQTAAAGLWSATSGYGMGNPLNDETEAEEEEEISGVPSWEAGIDTLDDEREAAKKAEKAEKKQQQQQTTANGGGVSSSQKAASKGGSTSANGLARTASRSKQVPVVEIETLPKSQRGSTVSANRKLARSSSASNLTPSRKANDTQGTKASGATRKTGAKGGQPSLDKMFAPTKKALSVRSVSESGVKFKGGAGAGAGQRGSSGVSTVRSSSSRASRVA